MAYAKGIFLAVLTFIPSIAFAGTIVTEVMYDVPGTDTGREWVEFQNTGAQTIDLAGWKLFESNATHTITISQGAGVPPGGYAVIADNPAKFLADWPSYTGVLFDSAFSLSNAGESIVLRNDAGTDAASVTYDPSKGAGGDGNSLQWNGSAWVSAAPTPGSRYVTGTDAPPSEDTSGQSQQTTQTTATSTQNTTGFPVEKNIFADAGLDRTVFVGADAAFTARAIGLTGEPLENARYVWTFGDGGRLEGQSVSYHYSYPGTYVVFLDVSSGRYAATDRATVTAVPAEVSIPIVTSKSVHIKNGSDVELDLGGWILSAGGKSFAFPVHTVIAAGETVIISGERTGIMPSSPEALSLLYPNGVFAASHEVPLIAGRIPASSSGAAARTYAPREGRLPAEEGAATGTVAAQEEGMSPESSQAAAIALAESGGGNGFGWWLGGLALLAGLAIAALFFFPGKKEPSEEGGAAYVITEEE